MKINYCNINDWLHIGRFTIMFDNWTYWFKRHQGFPIIRQWTLFQFSWDNGVWFANEMANTEDGKIITVSKMNGSMIENRKYETHDVDAQCYFQIYILGIGIRFDYVVPMRIARRIE